MYQIRRVAGAKSKTEIRLAAHLFDTLDKDSPCFRVLTYVIDEQKNKNLRRSRNAPMFCHVDARRNGGIVASLTMLSFSIIYNVMVIYLGVLTTHRVQLDLLYAQ